jgi:hypothetical protein
MAPLLKMATRSAVCFNSSAWMTHVIAGVETQMQFHGEFVVVLRGWLRLFHQWKSKPWQQ